MTTDEAAALEALIERFAASDDHRTAVGPVVYREQGGARLWYLTVGYRAAGECRLLRIEAGANRRLAYELRQCLLTGLVRRADSRMTVVACADEFALAEVCAGFWPGPKTRRLLHDLSAQYAAISEAAGATKH